MVISKIKVEALLMFLPAEFPGSILLSEKISDVEQQACVINSAMEGPLHLRPSAPRPWTFWILKSQTYRLITIHTLLGLTGFVFVNL